MAIKDNFKKGSVELLVLAVLSKEDMYGYQITQKIKEYSDGLFTVLEGSLYPILYRLSNEGYVTENAVAIKRRMRVYYHLEESGKEYFKKCLEEYRAVNLGVEKVLKQSEQSAE
ncbi:MAG: PadR family transcriptional regulator [Oscillospiraceae bacterium]|nr:PadR family transcriptional regulator [Oscillospiraceae bacterium]